MNARKLSLGANGKSGNRILTRREKEKDHAERNGSGDFS
jgi:hypothetical protein